MDASSSLSGGRGGRNPKGPAKGYGHGRDNGGGGDHGRGDGSERGGGYGQGHSQTSDWKIQGGDENRDSSNYHYQRRQHGFQGFKFDPTVPKTNQFERFIFTGLQRCPPHKLPDVIQSAGTLWDDCWRKASELPIPQLRVVLSALARLPFSSSIDPPHIRDVSHGVFSLVGELASGTIQQWMLVEMSEAKLEAVELVEKLFERLIKFTWKVPKADVKCALTDMLSEAEGLLEGRHASHRTARKRIELLFEQLEISWTIKTAEVSAGTTGIVASDTAGPPAPLSWKHPTVGWLADWNHFQPLKLPKMKVPGGKGNGVYNSPEEYFELTLKLWIGMTFVDGNNALLPHCTVKGASGKVCDQPLWPILSNGLSGGGALRLTCRSSHCTRNVEFMCANRNHDRGLCRLCANHRQELLRGPPSTHASTHIYDGSVTSVQYDGTIYVDNFASRKTPMGTVHWKTTKRLACPNLVGIVLLESRGESLRLADDIYWARVALHGDSRDEFRERENGKVALSLLNYSSDNSPNPLLDQNISKGAAVAIIDCQTFVPEFIPVLTALERQSEMPMPFESGALLNLCKRASIASPEAATLFQSDNGMDNDGLPSFSSIDSDDDDDDDDKIPMFSLYHTNSKLKRLIEELVDESTLDPVVQIRRDERLRVHLQYRLYELVQTTTLDNGQLESFLAALRSPVHCTQGPPGTGKSYLGVVIVRALLIIRRLWMTVSDSVGAPPILVLSYKNHAIDEFLLDLVRKEPSMNHRMGRRIPFGYSTYRPLVRIGGGCSEPELFPYQEYNASRKSAQVQQLAAQIGNFYALQDKLNRFQDRFTVIKESQFVVLDKNQSDHDEERKKRDKKACHDGAVELKQVGGAILACMKAVDSHAIEDADGDVIDNEDAEDKSQRLLKIFEDVIGNGASPLTRADIPLLYDGIRHYDHSMDPAEILHRWVFGFVPMPSCAATHCEEISDGESAFCSYHRCHFLFGDLEGARCEDVITDHRKFCASHICSRNHCKRSRASEKQLYCNDHVCFVCLADTSVEIAGEATEEPPRNTCELHPLCWSWDTGDFCSNLAIPGDSHCEVHAQLGCQAVKKDGKPCKGVAISRNVKYCYDHRAQHIDKTKLQVTASPVQDSAGSLKCHSLNAKGKPCGSQVRPGSKYCSAHLSKADAEVANKDLANSLEVTGSKSADTKPLTASSLSASPGFQDGDEIEDTRVSITKHSTIEVRANKVSPADAVDDDDEDLEMFSCSSGSEADFDANTFDFDNYDEVEESEHLQHLREVDEIADVVKEDDNGLDDDEKETRHEDGHFEFELTSSAVDGVATTAEWSWEMSVATRWACVSALLNQWGPVSHLLLQTLKHAISAAKKQMYFEELKQKARAFEGKAVIGGTITGCVARLEAIRATNPFAILVEEASEVLEPLLFSCLCSSTCKLEMIGDHLQLQPSVMSKFDFERVNNINISMFERLIRSPLSNPVPASVLSIQRRMRRDICDLTREFYADITEIEDHEVCLTKTIQAPVVKRQWKGFVNVPTPNLLPYSEGEGREVPGVSPHLFFWEHSGAEERARVGLSRINRSEAEMACSLAAYLVTCGVPPASVAILTPYKGQLMFMRDLLMRKYNLVKLTKQASGPQAGQQKPSPSCVLSTVDRFQGDEADVVIISLVIDGKSRTPFVKLQNRMIVLLSRARIGMYVIGNTEYFGETSHWKATFDLLRKNAPSDNASEVDEECRTFEGPRIGTKLPLCCPQHRGSTALASEPGDLKLSFCTVVCEKMLPCSHECGLRCHWPNIRDHNQSCKVPIESPCVNHPRSMACSYFCTAARRSDIASALQIYRCDVNEVLELPCSHEQTLMCATKADILSGRRPYPMCTEKAITPYVNPTCKHLVKDCSCVDFYRFTAGRAPPCEKGEEYFASCGHRVILKCYRRTEIMADPSKFVCKEQVTTRLPRCGHSATVACTTVKMFDAWTGKALTTYGVVDEGISYGSKDYSCAEMVIFRRKCGHQEKIKCEQAFDIARAPPPCRNVVSFVNPECGHTHQTTCFEAAKFSGIALRALDEDEIAKTPLTHVNESERGAQWRNIGLGIQCSESVMLTRKCQHSEKVTCDIARHLTTTCKELVIVTNPCCGHQICIPCEHAEKVNQWQPWSVGGAAKKSVALLHESGILEDTLSPPLSLPATLVSLLRECEHWLLLRRAKSCGHELRMKCGAAMKLLNLDGKSKAPPCLEQVTKTQVPCGHEIQVACSRDISSMKCNLMTDKQCWNFDQCKTTVRATCSTSSTVVHCTTDRVDRLPPASTWSAQSHAHGRANATSRATVYDSGKVEYLDRLHLLLVAQFPWASGIQLHQSWDGKTLCIGDTVLPVAIECALCEKLSFVTAASGSSPSASQKAKASGSRPFAGIKYLANIVKKKPFQEADLLLSLEQLAIQKADTLDAETKLDAYVSTTKSTPGGYCHPLVLIAFARLASSKKNSRVQPIEFLKIFRELYPDAGDYWLSPDERALLDSKDQKSSQADANAKRSPDDISFDERWSLMKQQDGCESDAMDELLKMVGLRRVKDSALKLFKSALALSKMEAAKRKKNLPTMNYCFMGNPGTGKTTVARLFARILNDSGMRRNENVVMCGAQEVKDDGPVKFRAKVKNAMGGVIFIDEAYELDPMGDSKGKPIVAELLTVAEDKRDDLSIILAGYEDDIQQKLYKYNDGIKSRFEEIHFDDFDEADLKVVWDGLLAEKEWMNEDKCGVIACRRLARGAGVKGFGNARAVRQLFEKSTQAAMAREDFNGITEIRTVDVLGERPTKNPKLRAVLKELSSKIGWRAIKDKVVELVKICDKNYERELNGVDTIPVSMNRLFLGNPGTGKTTCATIYGRVLKCLNFLSIGDVVKKTAGDFVGQYAGQSQTKTVDILKMAKGKVLVIDEAYNLDDNLYGKQVLDVLVEKVQGNEGDDIAVILIGYEQQMLEMLRTQNPGLARRFPQQYAFYFDDYSEQELLDIFLAACAKKNVHCPLEVSELVIRQLSLQKTQANFGNAGAVELILKSAIANASARPLNGDTIVLVVEDVEDDLMRRARLESAKESAGRGVEQVNDPLAVLNGLYRVEHIKDKLRQIQTSIQVAQDEGSDIPKIGHFVFRGSPGTGKTTVARVVAKIFHRMGILATHKLVETSGLNLTGEYVGQTKKRVEDQLGQARGGVLFIDEAYELGKGHFGEEAMTSLVAAMTNPMYAGMVIIIAGYPRDLDEMLNRNAGLKSRFTRYVDFYDWETDDCVEFTLATSNKEGYSLSQDAVACVRRTFDALRALPMFGNGRDVMQLWHEMIDCRAQRVKRNPELVKTITLTDAEAAARTVLAGRKPAAGAAMRKSSLPLNGPPPALDSALRQDISTSVDEAKGEIEGEGEKEEIEEEDEKEEEVVDRWSHTARDEGVADDTWAELERAKRDYDEMLRALQDERDKKTQDDAKDELKKFIAVQEKLRRLSKCPVGFVWLQVGGGWRCAGGSHFVSDAELERSFMY